jgi:thymidylate synthase ThyX
MTYRIPDLPEEYEVRIVCDSVSKAGARLTTFVCTYPRFIHAEVMTHRMLSKNVASSRAIPIEKMIDRVMSNPAMPAFWGKNQKGMQAFGEAEQDVIDQAKKSWLHARDIAVEWAKRMNELGIHKQIANRLVEPFMLTTAIITGTEWENFFALRNSEHAQPEFACMAKHMQELYEAGPTQDGLGSMWHLPLLTESEKLDPEAALISAARCARISYLKLDPKSREEEIELAKTLIKKKHMSPFEHQAKELKRADRRSGNFFGWKQFRKTIAGENVGRSMD